MGYAGNNTVLGAAGAGTIDRWWLTDSAIRALWPLSRTQSFDNVIADQYHMAAVNGAEVGANGLICVSATNRYASAGNVLNKARLAISYGCWAYVATGTARGHAIMGKTQATSSGARFSFGQEFASQANIHIQTGISTTNASPSFDIRDAWHFFAATTNGDAHIARLYVDGNLIVSSPSQGSSDRTSTFPYNLGRYGTFETALDGLIDDAFHFERALSQTEIQQMQAAGRGRLYS